MIDLSNFESIQHWQLACRVAEHILSQLDEAMRPESAHPGYCELQPLKGDQILVLARMIRVGIGELSK